MSNLSDMQKRLLRTLAVFGVTAVIVYSIAAIFIYLCMPQWYALNASTYILIAVFAFPFVMGIVNFIFYDKHYDLADDLFASLGVSAIVFIVIVAIIAIWATTGTNMYRADKNYSFVTERVEIVEESVFPQLIEGDDISKLPLFGEEEAEKKAAAELAKETALGSQTSVHDNFMSQEVCGKFVYVGESSPNTVFKKDAANQYYLIDRNTGESSSVSANNFRIGTKRYFSENVQRYIVKNYSGNGYISDIHLEIDENGKPYYVGSILVRDVFESLLKVDGVVICDPTTKEMKTYRLDQIPSWVDRVYPEDVLISYIEVYGQYGKGFLNSLFKKEGVLEPSSELNEDEMINYVYEVVFIDGEPCIYTGLQTANAVSSSSADANGMIIASLKTGKIKYYANSGVSESHAMKKAEGLVKDKGYIAGFPVPLKVNGIEALFMLMRDDANNLTGFSLVAYGDYTKAAYSENLSDCITSFLGNVGYQEENILSNDEIETLEGVVDDIATEVIDGRTVYYFKINNGIYSCNSKINVDVAFTEKGDLVVITYVPSKSRVNAIKTFEIGDAK